MPDNVGYTPGSGTTIAADDVGGVPYQRVKLAVGADGAATDVSAANQMPVNASYGELIAAVEALRMAAASLTKSIGYMLPNTQGFPIFEPRQSVAGNLLISAVQNGTWNTSTVTTLTNQSQVGGFAANDQIPALMHLQADNLRRNISVS